MEKRSCIAVVGCGRIAQGVHFPAFSRMGNVRVKYACDIVKEKAEMIKKTYPDFVENAVFDYTDALLDPEVEAVYVLTPNYAHYTVTMDALKHGKHVFCEKPITVNYALSEEMAKEAEKQDKLLCIGVCNRYNKAVEILHQMNLDGKFGKIYHVYCSFRAYRNIPGLGGSFTNKKQSGGGVLIDWGVHFLDLVLYILDGAKIKTATCDAYSEMAKDMKKYSHLAMWAEDTSDTEKGVNDVDDFVAGHIRTDKASISFTGAWAQNINKDELYIDILGDKGGARLSYGEHFEFWTQDEYGTLLHIVPEFNIPQQHETEDRAFIEAVKTGEKIKNHISYVLESAKLLETLYMSAEAKKEISL